MFPDVDLIPINADTVPSNPNPRKVLLFDFATRQYVLKDGKPVEATYEQAIKQWVIMLIITEMDQYPVYRGTGFGIQFKHFIGNREIPIGVINSELKRQLEEKALMHPQIIGVDDFSVSREGERATISFSLQTLNGLIEGIESEVTLDGQNY